MQKSEMVSIMKFSFLFLMVLIGSNFIDQIMAEAKVPAPAGNPRVITTLFPTDDLVIASFVVTDLPYRADNTGVKDATAAIQNALDNCYDSGGGTVFVPAGKYKVTSSIIIPSFVTLRGDWRDPDIAGKSYGTVFVAAVPSGGKEDPGLFRIKGSAGVIGLTVYYPNQSAVHPVSYPYTFEIVGKTLGDDGFMHASVQKCTLLNSYRGISGGISISASNTAADMWKALKTKTKITASDGRNIHELHTIRDVKGTVLLNPLSIYDCSDVGRIERCKFNNSYWANSSKEFNPPSRAGLDRWTRANGTGFELGDSEWEEVVELSLSDYQTGIAILPGSRAKPSGEMFGVKVLNSNRALVIRYVDDRSGYMFFNSTFQANIGTDPVAAEVINDNGGNVLFNNCTFGDGSGQAVKLTGNTMASFLNCVFGKWTAQYGLEASNGTLVIEGSKFLPALSSQKRAILLKSGLHSAVLLGNSFTGAGGYFMTNHSSGEVKRRDQGYILDQPNVPPYPWKTLLPRPVNNNLFNAAQAPYLAPQDGGSDAAPAIQAALDDAAMAGGGTVYLPPGHYRINSHLTVPENVELRGSSDVPHRGNMKGTVLYAVEGRNTPIPDRDTALITLNGKNAGIRGLALYYPDQAMDSAESIVPYPYAIRGNGEGVYAINIACVNVFKAIDFSTYPCNNHYLKSITGCILHDGISVGPSNEGWIEDCSFNGNAWSRTTLPNRVPEEQLFNVIFPYTWANQTAFTIAGAKNEHLLNNFVFGAKTGFDYRPQAEAGPNAVAVNCSADGSVETVNVSGTGPGGVTLINSELCPYNKGNNGDALDISGGTVRVFNMMVMEGNEKAVRISGGNSILQGVSFHRKSALVTGGVSSFNGVLFLETGLDVTVGPDGACNLYGNIGAEGFQVDFQPGSKGISAENIKR